MKHKDTETGLLRDMMIYDYSEGFNKVSVMVADSGRLKTSADKMFLVLSYLMENPLEAWTSNRVPQVQKVPFLTKGRHSKAGIS